ncbi:MAG: hypothetical protein A2139_14230 [Desulfobacca sp. RBG_16_60_12]|nr:MAG: hypothetical protein A2139_14230 [Desulfobacca sp. RBG_16_60_12]
MSSKIEWTEEVWNPISRCGPSDFSPGCNHCYARRMSKRLASMSRKLYVCQSCDAEIGDGEDDNGRCPYCFGRLDLVEEGEEE